MNKQEIIKALEQGLKVHWSNSGYKVFLQQDALYVLFTRNGYMTQLQESEYNDCFIGA